MDIFEHYVKGKLFGSAPLATRMRPRALAEFVGQKHLIGEGKLLARLITNDRVISAIFFGPPGSGKTSLVKLLGETTKSHFITISAVTSSVSQVREVIAQARQRLTASGNSTSLFVDEFHRFNRAQQEVLLPHIEEGLIGFVGLTTYNPFVSMAPALLSRSHIFEFKPLNEDEILTVLKRALGDDERGLGRYRVDVDEGVLRKLACLCEGDARRALNTLELAVVTAPLGAEGRIRLTEKIIEEALQKKIIPYDRAGDQHYDTISAFIKSIRGSDPDAALYWLAKMLRGGEDPRFIARRLVILASEDVGNADPAAISLTVNVARAVEFVGLPECQLVLAQAVTYLAAAPKSNASWRGLSEALQDIDQGRVQEVPAHLKNASAPGSGELNRGVGYRYPHNHPEGWVKQEYLKGGRRYYRPTERGFEAIIKKRLQVIDGRLTEISKQNTPRKQFRADEA